MMRKPSAKFVKVASIKYKTYNFNLKQSPSNKLVAFYSKINLNIF